MFNSFYIFVLRLNNKSTSDGQVFLAIIELIATAVVIGAVCK